MTRLRGYSIECDGCRKVVEDGNASCAIDDARRRGWLLRGKRRGKVVDLCKTCRRNPDIEFDDLPLPTHG